MNVFFGRRNLARAFGGAAMSLACAWLMGAASWAGERPLRGQTAGASAPASTNSVSPPDSTAMVANGRRLFLLNCAHCHAQDATGDEGPDLHGVVRSDAKIAALIKNGVKGEMPRFGAKLSDTDVQMLIAYLRSLD
jgi:mono/diheme cytochrome c family protein